MIRDVAYCLWKLRIDDAFVYALNLVGADNTADIGGEDEQTVEKTMESLEKEVMTSDLVRVSI